MLKFRWIKNKFLYLGKVLGRGISGFRNTRRGNTEEKHILLYCQSKTMEEHLLNFIEQIEDNSKYKIYLYFGYVFPADLYGTLFRGKNVTAIGDEWKLYLMKWDLIVCPDMDYPFWLKRGTIPVLYIGHGSGGISYDGGEHSYDYSTASLDEKGRPLFDIMLEPNKETARRMKKDPIYGEIIRSSGYRFAAKIKDASLDKYQYQKQLGIQSGSKVVSIWGSWNKDSLFHVFGTELFSVCKSLQEKGYVFILSIHPREYEQYDENITPLGAVVERQREEGFLVRSPGEDWLPYMMASDVILVDYSAMLSLAILSGKKVILSNFPDERIWRKSMYYEAKHIFPVIKSPYELEHALDMVEHDSSYDDAVREFQDQLYVSREDYKKFIQNVVEELTGNQSECR